MRRVAVLCSLGLLFVFGPVAPALAEGPGTGAHAPVPTAGPVSTRDEILTKGEKLYSQFKEELVIRHFFDDRRGGFFVDVGAYHWKNASTTLYLEKHLGWTGFAIDAQGHLRAGYEKNRPGTRFFHYIVTDHSGTEETLHLAGPISSTKASHIADVGRAYDRPDVVEYAQSHPRPTASVPTITLNELLDAQGVEKIDFLSLDIEQGEPAALAGFDIDRFAPELVCVEAFPTVQAQLLAYFEAHGYERIDAYLEHDANWYFRPKQGAGADEE